MSRALRLGLFMVGTLAVLTAGVFLIGDRDLLFSSTYSVKANFKNVAGLNNGGDVRVGGIHEGTVKRIDLPGRPDQQVTVVMDLKKTTRSVLKKDSVVAIKSDGLLGDKYIEISFGSPEAEALRNGDTLNTAPPIDISDLIKKTDSILDSAKGALQGVEGTANNMEAISSTIKQGKGTLGAMVNDKTMYQEATAGAASFADNMEAMKHNFLLRGFFKKRGYQDSDQLTKNQIPKLPAEAPEKKFEYDISQLFAKPDTAKLKNEKMLAEVGKFLEEGKYGLVVIAASAGMKGDSAKDRELTEAQAMVVRDYLTKNFRFDDTRVRTLGMGKTEGDEAKVDIIVYSGTPAGKPAGTPGAAAQNPKVAKH
jgi:phospholipid/cholesterol/gamma-HCH transport system substrate-binding protein